jgi:hypothetical protein
MLALLSALSISSPATAFTGIISFDGACSDCSALGGPGTASATISLTDYNWGENLPGSVAFTYTSELLGTLSPYYAYNTAGSFASASSAAADVYLEFSIFGTPSSDGFYTFQSHVAGDWVLTVFGSPADIGSSHTWSATAPVPEPEIYAMLGVGLGLMGWVGRRRKLQAA